MSAPPTKSPATPQATLPLAGVRVLELGTAWAGPFCGRLLSDLGAEVIKIESRRRLDTRGPAAPPPGSGTYPDGLAGETPWNRAALFHERNRGKLSLALELDQPDGREVMLALARSSNIVLENFSPRVLPQMRVDWSNLSRVNPALVMISMSGFGQTGPERDYVAYGPTLEQASGLASLMGYADGPPMSSGLYFPDVISGTLAAGLAVAALRGARATGKGTYIDLGEIEAVRWMLGHLTLAAQTGSRAGTARLGNRDEWRAPQGCYPASGDDAWVVLTVETDDQWQAMTATMGLPRLAAEYPTARERRTHHDEIDRAVHDWIARRTAEAVVADLIAAGIPAGQVASVDQVVANEHLTARKAFDQHPIPGSHARTVAGGFWTFDGQRLGMRFRASDLGEHNEYVLREVLGLDDARIEALAKSGAVGRMPRELEAQ